MLIDFASHLNTSSRHACPPPQRKLHHIAPDNTAWMEPVVHEDAGLNAAICLLQRPYHHALCCAAGLRGLLAFEVAVKRRCVSFSIAVELPPVFGSVMQTHATMEVPVSAAFNTLRNCRATVSEVTAMTSAAAVLSPCIAHLEYYRGNHASGATVEALFKWCPAVSISVHGFGMATVVGHSFAAGCSSLVELDVVDGAFSSATAIEHGFLYRCYRLERVRFSGEGTFANVTSIGDSFLFWCGRIESVDLSAFANLATVGSSFMEGCTSLTSVDFTPCTQLRTIGDAFMKGCKNLERVQMESFFRVATIGHSFMCDNRRLSHLELGALQTLRSFGPDFLKGCDALPLDRSRAFKFAGGLTTDSPLCLPVPLIG